MHTREKENGKFKRTASSFPSEHTEHRDVARNKRDLDGSVWVYILLWGVENHVEKKCEAAPQMEAQPVKKNGKSNDSYKWNEECMKCRTMYICWKVLVAQPRMSDALSGSAKTKHDDDDDDLIYVSK